MKSYAAIKPSNTRDEDHEAREGAVEQRSCIFYMVRIARLSSYGEPPVNPFYDRRWLSILKPAIYPIWCRYPYGIDSVKTSWSVDKHVYTDQIENKQRQTHNVRRTSAIYSRCRNM